MFPNHKLSQPRWGQTRLSRVQLNVGMLLKILFSEMWGSAFQKPISPCNLSAFPLKQKIQNLAVVLMFHFNPISKENVTQTSAEKWQAREWRWFLWLMLLQINDGCLGARKNVLKYTDFLLGRFLQDLSHYWHQLTMTQQEIANKENHQTKILFSNWLVLLSFCWDFCLNLTANHWQAYVACESSYCRNETLSQRTMIAFYFLYQLEHLQIAKWFFSDIDHMEAKDFEI